MSDLKLSSKEKIQIEILIRNVQKLARVQKTNEIQRYIKKRHLRAIMIMLGTRKPGLALQKKALDIILDGWPLKIYRLRKMIKTWTTKAVNVTA